MLIAKETSLFPRKRSEIEAGKILHRYLVNYLLLPVTRVQLPPSQALRFQSQAGELEARETGDEHARDHGKEKEKTPTRRRVVTWQFCHFLRSGRGTAENEAEIEGYPGRDLSAKTGNPTEHKNTIFTIRGKRSIFAAGAVSLDLHLATFFVDARLRLWRRKIAWLRLILSGDD